MATRRRMTSQDFYWFSRKTLLHGEDLLMYGYDTVDIAATYRADGVGKCAENFDFDFYESLLPVPASQWSPQNAERLPPFYMNASVFPLDTLLNYAASLHLDSDSWIQLFKKTLHRHKLKIERNSSLLNNPVTVVQLGHRIAKIAGRRLGAHSNEFAQALIFIGIGATALSVGKRCAMCYRNTVVGLIHCVDHSQSKYLRGEFNKDLVKQSQKARTGRLATKKLGWDVSFPSLFSLHPLESAFIAGILWPTDQNNLGLREDILEAIELAPLVKEKLPKDFYKLDSDHLIRTLRNTLDPNQWREISWPETIKNAQVWFGAELSVAPGKPPTGLRTKNVLRREKALEWKAEGMSLKEIAERLGITSSHLCKILSRYQ